MACPICKKSRQTAFRPFCSKRCADIDLGNWFSGSYAIPAQAAEDIDELEQELEAVAQKKPH